jgi:hypothetical protein
MARQQGRGSFKAQAANRADAEYEGVRGTNVVRADLTAKDVVVLNHCD